MLVSEEARVFQVRGLRCSKEPTVLGLGPVRLGNRTYRAWRTTKLTPMVRFLTAPDLSKNSGLVFRECHRLGYGRAPTKNSYELFEK